MATTPDITTVEMTRSFSWTRLISQLLIAVVLFVAANVVTYETSGFFRKEHEYQQVVAGIAQQHKTKHNNTKKTQNTKPQKNNQKKKTTQQTNNASSDKLNACFK